MAAHRAHGLLPPVKSARGLTLVELMITATILSLVMMATLTLYRSGLFAYTKYRERQERTDQCELLFSSLSADLREAKTVEFVEPYRLGLKMPDSEENGRFLPGATVIYEFQQTPASCLMRTADGEAKRIAAEVENLTFARALDGATITVDYKCTGMSRLVCVLPVGAAGALARPYPESSAGRNP